jgi:murein DD-endopeptidase MepM/ murein hydrolase activator NlpD
MAKIKYYYDTETCQYEPVKISRTDYLTNIAGFLILAALTGFGFTAVYRNYFPSAKEAELLKDNQELLLKYEFLNKEFSNTNNMLAVLQERDDNIYRTIFEAEPIAMEIRKGGTGGTEKYRELLDEKLKREDLILATIKKVDNLKKQMYIQTKSYDELMSLAKQKSTMMASMPAIMPLTNKDLQTFASGFGYRVHPIYKVPKMHTGCDLTAAQGSPVYASGDGVIISSEWYGGYGNQVEVDHGFGYVTKYAHLSAFKCKKGQKVKRGQLIGLVGTTGTSVAPHLHYEVIKNGEKVNPVHYFFNDLSAEQYEKMLEIASQNTQSLGG